MAQRFIRKTRAFLVHFTTHPRGYVTECGSSAMRVSNNAEVVTCPKCRSSKAFKTVVQEASQSQDQS